MHGIIDGENNNYIYYTHIFAAFAAIHTSIAFTTLRLLGPVSSVLSHHPWRRCPNRPFSLFVWRCWRSRRSLKQCYCQSWQFWSQRVFFLTISAAVVLSTGDLAVKSVQLVLKGNLRFEKLRKSTGCKQTKRIQNKLDCMSARVILIVQHAGIRKLAHPICRNRACEQMIPTRTINATSGKVCTISSNTKLCTR